MLPPQTQSQITRMRGTKVWVPADSTTPIDRHQVCCRIIRRHSCRRPWPALPIALVCTSRLVPGPPVAALSRERGEGNGGGRRRWTFMENAAPAMYYGKRAGIPANVVELINLPCATPLRFPLEINRPADTLRQAAEWIDCSRQEAATSAD